MSSIENNNEDFFEWGDGIDHAKEYKRKRVEAQHETAKLFVEHLKKIINNQKGSQATSIQISQKDLYADFKYPKIAAEAWLNFEKKNYAEYEKGAWCAYKEGLILIDDSVRPYEYTLVSKNDVTFKLRPYQKNIVEDATDADGSVLIEAPTGSGKSVMASEIAKHEVAKSGKVLIVAPKIILLEQLRETFMELKPQIIHGAKDYDHGHSIFISTIQTAHKRDLGFEPTMILIDEVHFGFSGKMIKELLSDFNGKLIGLSATPYDEKGVPLKGFDLHIHKYNLKYMLENKYLIHPKCYAPLKVNLSNIGMVGADYNQADLDSEFNNLDSILQIVESTKEIVLKRKASLIFCINIAHSEAVAKAFNDAGVPTKAMHSKISKDEQRSILSEYKSGKLKMLANPMMLTTGFDHPVTDTLILARATKSQNLYKQMVGRALRLSDGKEDAVILDCSNVIGNLGLPTEDIKERDNSQVKGVRVCSECKSEKLYKKVKNNKVYMQCADCGHTEMAMENGYECEACSLVHTHDAKFITKEGNLYLICSDCEHETMVSEAASKEEMSLIFDSTYINEIQKKITLTYLKYLMDKYSPSFALEAEVSKHVKAIQMLILKDPTIFVDIDSDYFSYHTIMEDINSSDRYIWHTDFQKSWRIFDITWEDEILNEGLKELNKNLTASVNLKNSFDIIQIILKVTKTDLLDTRFIENFLSDVKRSKVKNMDKICNKRIKDLYFNNEDLMQIDGFVQMMETVL